MCGAPMSSHSGADASRLLCRARHRGADLCRDVGRCHVARELELPTNARVLDSSSVSQSLSGNPARGTHRQARAAASPIAARVAQDRRRSDA